MNYKTAALELADLIMNITDPKVTKWHKEQLETNARVKARRYIQNVGANND